MAKFACVCGTTISTSGNIPNENEWKLLSDVEFDKYSGRIDVEVLYQSATIAFRCPVSDHLWIFWDGFDKAPQLYEPVPGGEKSPVSLSQCEFRSPHQASIATCEGGQLSQESVRDYRRDVSPRYENEDGIVRLATVIPTSR